MRPLKSIFFNNFLRMTPCLVNIITLATQLSGCKRSAPTFENAATAGAQAYPPYNTTDHLYSDKH